MEAIFLRTSINPLAVLLAQFLHEGRLLVELSAQGLSFTLEERLLGKAFLGLAESMTPDSCELCLHDVEGLRLGMWL